MADAMRGESQQAAPVDRMAEVFSFSPSGSAKSFSRWYWVLILKNRRITDHRRLIANYRNIAAEYLTLPLIEIWVA